MGQWTRVELKAAGALLLALCRTQPSSVLEDRPWWRDSDGRRLRPLFGDELCSLVAESRRSRPIWSQTDENHVGSRTRKLWDPPCKW